MAKAEFEFKVCPGRSVDLGWTSGATGGALADLDIATTDELVQVVPGHVGMQASRLGHLASTEPAAAGMDQQVHLPSAGVAESGRDRIDHIGKVIWAEGYRSHVDSLAGVHSPYPRRRNSVSSNSPTEDQVIEALRPVQDPELHRSIVDLGMVRSVTITGTPTGSNVEVGIDLTIAGCPLRAEINNSVSAAVQTLDGVEEVAIEFGVMTDEQREAVRRSIHGDPGASAGSQQAHGHAEGRAIPFADEDSRTRVILVASGKGGVGKSSVTTNLAVALAAQGKSVAVVDADVWGFSIPRMLGTDRSPTIIDEMIVPPEAHGVRCISMGFFVEEDQPVIWRGPMLHKALEQFLTDVYWDEPDFLLVDLPPGTGDISLSLAQFLPRSEMVVVTTPQPAAQKVAQRAAYMAKKVNIKVSGVVENMSWFVGDDGKRYDLFGSGGGQELADDLGVPLMAQIPLVPQLREGGDSGDPIAAQPDTEAGQCFAVLAERLVTDFAPKQRYRSELKVM